MKILIAEDEPGIRSLLERLLQRWGYEVTAASDGEQAWQILSTDTSFSLMMLDWNMPGISGLELCAKIRQKYGSAPAYIIILTARGEKQDLVDALQTGADDYLTKPFDMRELEARVNVGKRVLDLHLALEDQIQKLEEAIGRINQLHGLLPICAYCKKIRGDQNYWQQVEEYFSGHTDLKFSHSMCPDCRTNIWEPQVELRKQKRRTES